MDSAPATPDADKERSSFARVLDSLRIVFGDRSLRRLQYAFAGSLIGDGAYSTAIAVYLYATGGASAVGIYVAVKLVLMSVVAPLGAVLVDRLPHQRVLVASDLARFVLLVVATVCIATGAPSLLVVVLAVAAGVAGSVFIPARSSWLPSLVERPEQLTATNAASSSVESISFFVGPALGAGLVAATDVQTVVAINAASFLLSGLLIASVRSRAKINTAPDEEPDDAVVESPGMIAEVTAGFRQIWQDKGLLAVAILACLQTVVAGASAVFTLLMAVEILHTGAEGVGYVDASLGVGAVVGGAIALSRATRGTITIDFTAGVVLWSAPLVLVTVWPSTVSVFVAIALIGLGNPLVDVNFATIVQRVVPEAVLGRVFGAFESLLIGAMALGAALMPALVHGVGLRTAIAIIAAVVVVPVVLTVPALRRLSVRLAPPAGLELVRSAAIFAPLSPEIVDQIARSLVRLPVAAGDVIVREGGVSDRFFVIESGEVEVTQGDTVLRREGAGEFFGEIGLLRDVARTATVTAVVDTVLYSLTREPFLRALSADSTAAAVAEEFVDNRLRFAR